MRNLFKRNRRAPQRDMVQYSDYHFPNFILSKMDWIKKNIWQTILVALITVIFSTLGSLYIWHKQREVEKVQGCAPYEYVDKKTDDLKIYIDVQDLEIKSRVNNLESRQIQKAEKSDVDQIRALLQDQNRMIFELLKDSKK